MKKNIFFTLFLIGSMNILSPIKSNEIKKDLDSNIEIKESGKMTSVNNLSNQYQYLIGAGDVLDVRIFDSKEYNGRYVVLNDGKVTLPLIGNIYLENNTVEEAINILNEEYSKVLVVPDVYMTVFSSRPINLSVVGEVEKPGLYNLKKNNIDGPFKIIDGLRAAGGITSKSNLAEVELIRIFKENGKLLKKSAPLNLIPLIERGDQTNNIKLLHGDIIKIKKTNNLTKSQYKYAKETFSPTAIGITVVGEVKEPGVKKTNSGISLFEAVMIAGGPVDWQANKQNIQLIREDDNGQIFVQKFRFNINEKISILNNPKLKDGDIINVNSTSYTKISRGINNVFTPLRDIITAVTFYKLIDD